MSKNETEEFATFLIGVFVDFDMTKIYEPRERCWTSVMHQLIKSYYKEELQKSTKVGVIDVHLIEVNEIDTKAPKNDTYSIHIRLFVQLATFSLTDKFSCIFLLNAFVGDVR